MIKRFTLEDSRGKTLDAKERTEEDSFDAAHALADKLDDHVYVVCRDRRKLREGTRQIILGPIRPGT